MRLNEMIGKVIVSADTGAAVGHVVDLLLDKSRRHVAGVLVTDGVLSKQRVLPFGDVKTVGVDAIVARTVTTMCDARDWVRQGRPAHRSRSVLGKDVVTAEGARVGTLHGFVADERTGDIVALEIIRRRHGARLTQPALVQAVSRIQLTNDCVVLPPEVVVTRSE
jgi:sporulation protein YlmC with PRC-barrel domain